MCIRDSLDALHIPLTGYESLNTFKIYLEDTGILGALSGLDVNTLVNKSKLFSEFKGAFVEQYVCQQLVAQGIKPRYWANPNPQGNAEIDFVMEQGDEVFPIEVKSSSNIRARSLSYVCNKMCIRDRTSPAWCSPSSMATPAVVPRCPWRP